MAILKVTIGGYAHQWRYSFAQATADELRARFGDHLDWILRQPNPAATARGRAHGAWDANELELMSAYDRVADLIELGELAAAEAA